MELSLASLRTINDFFELLEKCDFFRNFLTLTNWISESRVRLGLEVSAPWWTLGHEVPFKQTRMVEI